MLNRTVGVAGGTHGAVAMTNDSVMAIFCTTKALSGICTMRSVDEGKVRLEAAAKSYVPEIEEIQGPDGFDSSGKPKTRAPKCDVTVNDLLVKSFVRGDLLAIRSCWLE